MTTITGKTFNIQRFSTEDGPGLRTTVFLKGCPLTCPWCHNPEGMEMGFHLMWTGARCIGDLDCVRACRSEALRSTPDGIRVDRTTCKLCGSCVDACPSAALEIIGREQSVEEVMNEALRDRAFYDNSGGGLTISGGEPLMQPEFTTALQKAAREAGVHVALDTSGYASARIFERAADDADMILMDLKCMDPQLHLKMTGVPLEPILENARRSAAMKKPLWVRLPVIPGYTYSDENIDAVADYVARELPNCERVDLLPFSNLCTEKYARLDRVFALKDAPLIQQSRMNALKERVEKRGVRHVTATGMTALNDGEKP